MLVNNCFYTKEAEVYALGGIRRCCVSVQNESIYRFVLHT